MERYLIYRNGKLHAIVRPDEVIEAVELLNCLFPADTWTTRRSNSLAKAQGATYKRHKAKDRLDIGITRLKGKTG